jgi:hypothetical protein
MPKLAFGLIETHSWYMFELDNSFTAQLLDMFFFTYASCVKLFLDLDQTQTTIFSINGWYFKP